MTPNKIQTERLGPLAPHRDAEICIVGSLCLRRSGARFSDWQIGLLFIPDGRAMQPELDHLDACATQTGVLSGHRPSLPQIGQAMFGRYSKMAPSPNRAYLSRPRLPLY